MDRKRLKESVGRIAAGAVSGQTPGFALMMAKDGEVLLSEGYGMADLEHGIPIRPDDNFIIASNTKQFTCVAILMLMSRGLLELDEPIERFFPDFPDYRKYVTIRQMMCHTTGIREYFEEGFRENEEALRTADTAALLDIVRGFGPLEFEPDTKFSYCNSAYVMLGDIVRQLTGKPFGRFLEEEIFAPLGMERTFAPDYMDVRDSYQVQGYEKQADGTFRRMPYDMLMVGYADGNISSNTADLLKWHHYLYESDSDLLLPRAVLNTAFEPHRLKDGSLSPYGFGFFLGECAGTHSKTYPGHREIWHTGGTMGFISRCSRFVDERVSVTMLTNYEGIQRDELFFPMLDVLFEELDRP